MTNFEVWKQHFIKQAKGLIPHEQSFYPVTTENTKQSDSSTPVKLVSPMQDVVERAKTDISNPTTPIYDPITGIMRQSVKRSRTVI